jgi:hypothetical protein
MMAQPRMEGPQSDKDVALYRQMSGQIGDPTVPGAIKQAALETIRGLHEKYAGMQPGESPAQGRQIGAARAHEGHGSQWLQVQGRQPRRSIELGESLMAAPWEEYAGTKADSKPWEDYGPAKGSAPTIADQAKGLLGNLAAGAVRGAGSIGATILTPVDAAARALGVQNDFIGRTDRREAMDGGLREMGADTDSLAFKGGKLGAEIAGTAGVGGALANGVRVLGATRAAAGLEPIIDGVARGLETGGFRVGPLAGAGGSQRLGLALAQRSAVRRLAWSIRRMPGPGLSSVERCRV